MEASTASSSNAMDDCLFIYRTVRSSIYSPRRSPIPDDVVFKIFSMAGFAFTHECSRSADRRGRDNENCIYLEMDVLTGHPTKFSVPISCTFVVESHDQGWTSEPGGRDQRNSFTWGEALVKVPATLVVDDTIQAERFEIYRNRRANSTYERQSITFLPDTPFMAALSRGYQLSNESLTTTQPEPLKVQLFTRSAFPGWNNCIRFASIQLTCEITESFCSAALKEQSTLASPRYGKNAVRTAVNPVSSRGSSLQKSCSLT